MPFAIEFSSDCERDFELIFEHLFESYVSFGERPETAFEHATHRILDIRRGAERLATFPFRGTLRDDILPGVRHFTVERVIYWFEVEEATQIVRVLAVFFGGQDHVRHALVRLLRWRSGPGSDAVS